MRFAVTGGAGFVGSSLVELLVDGNHSVTVIDDLSNGSTERLGRVLGDVDFHRMSVTDYDGLERVLRGADGVFHQAALTSVPESFEIPHRYREVNVGGTENVFRLSRRLGFKVVFASSASVYGDAGAAPVAEDAERIPANPYGETKLAGELLAQRYDPGGSRTVGLRYFNVFGAGQNPAYAGVVSKFLARAAAGEAPVIHGTGEQRRDFVFVGDVADANLRAMLARTGSAFLNVGTGISTSILELARTVIDASGLGLDPVFDEPLPGDVMDGSADTARITGELGWRPTTSIRRWLEGRLGA